LTVKAAPTSRTGSTSALSLMFIRSCPLGSGGGGGGNYVGGGEKF